MSYNSGFNAAACREQTGEWEDMGVDRSEGFEKERNKWICVRKRRDVGALMGRMRFAGWTGSDGNMGKQSVCFFSGLPSKSHASSSMMQPLQFPNYTSLKSSNLLPTHHDTSKSIQ